MKSSKISKKKRVDLGPEYLDPKNHKHRITMWIDGDLLAEIKARAADVGSPYQTLMQKLLRESVQKPSIEKRLEALEKKFDKHG